MENREERGCPSRARFRDQSDSISWIDAKFRERCGEPPHHLTHWPDRAFKYVEEKYEIELVELKHESLDAIHMQGFLNILGENLIRNILCLNNDSLIAQSFFDKVLSKCGSLIGRLLSKGYDNQVFMPVGHTVTAIFRKL